MIELPTTRPLDERERSLVELGRWLRDHHYAFVTPTPATHRRVNARPGNAIARDVAGAFGWSRPFTPALVPDSLLAKLLHTKVLVPAGDGTDREHLRSTVRYSTLRDRIYVHSAYPTTAPDSVFFGPDTYRFCALVATAIERADLVLDVGCGGGMGGLSVVGAAGTVLLADINPAAIACSRVNAVLAGAADRVAFFQGDLYAPFPEDWHVDAIIANPPYLVDPGARTYRDGGGALGIDLGVRIVREGLPHLAPGGKLVLYTGSPIVDGIDQVREALEPIVQAAGARWRYWELDPDVFGEELDEPAYGDVDRIAAVAAVVQIS